MRELEEIRDKDVSDIKNDPLKVAKVYLQAVKAQKKINIKGNKDELTKEEK